SPARGDRSFLPTAVPGLLPGTLTCLDSLHTLGPGSDSAADRHHAPAPGCGPRAGLWMAGRPRNRAYTNTRSMSRVWRVRTRRRVTTAPAAHRSPGTARARPPAAPPRPRSPGPRCGPRIRSARDRRGSNRPGSRRSARRSVRGTVSVAPGHGSAAGSPAAHLHRVDPGPGRTDPAGGAAVALPVAEHLGDRGGQGVHPERTDHHRATGPPRTLGHLPL